MRAIRWSMERVADLALSLCEGTYSLDELIRGFLYLSYRSERRLETSRKADRLLAAAADHYRRIYGQFLKTWASAGRMEFLPDDGFRAHPPPHPGTGDAP